MMTKAESHTVFSRVPELLARSLNLGYHTYAEKSRQVYTKSHRRSSLSLLHTVKQKKSSLSV